MDFNSFITTATQLTNESQFTKDQWRNIIDIAFQNDNNFNSTIERFYVELLGFDFKDCEDLITDIQNGNGDAFERFVNDICNYFNN